MDRVAVILRKSPDGRRCVALDDGAFNEIIKYIGQDQRHKNKFQDILNIILNNLKNRELYDKEDIDKDCKDVTAMKFFKGQENDRIYCKEIRRGDKTFVVVMGILHTEKTTTKNTAREKNLIRKVASYNYPDHLIYDRRPQKKSR